MKDLPTYFDGAMLCYEALTETPLGTMLKGISFDKQLEVGNAVVEDVRQFAEMNGLPHPDKKTWKRYRETANWNEFARQALEPSTHKPFTFLML